MVATPIGNPDDITLRALKILESVDIIAAEDTRVTGRFLKMHKLGGNMVSYHEHNEDERTPELLDKLENGFSVALVSDAGTPSVSDPGYRLITGAVNRSIPVVPVPGVSAAITALSVSGLPTDAFVFTGFLPRKKGRRLRMLQSTKDMPGTLIFYESPRRILKLMEEIVDELGDRTGLLAREMTKPHEEFIRGTLSEIRNELLERPDVKGECTLLVSGARLPGDRLPSEVLAKLKEGLQASDMPFSALVKTVARSYDIPKNRVYAAALAMRQSIEGDSIQDGKG